jgi:hypothetical protein
VNNIKKLFNDRLNVYLFPIAIYLCGIVIFSYEFNIYLNSSWIFSESTRLTIEMKGLGLKDAIFYTIQNFISNNNLSSYPFIFALFYKFVISDLEIIWKSFSFFSIFSSLFFLKKFIKTKENNFLYILMLTASPFLLYLANNGRHLFEIPILFALIYFIDTSFTKERSEFKLLSVSLLIFFLMTLNFFLSLQILIPLLLYFKSKLSSDEDKKLFKRFSWIFIAISLYCYHLIYFYTSYSRIFTVAAIIFVIAQLVLFSLVRINKYLNYFFFYPLFVYTGLIVLGGSTKVETFTNQFNFKSLGDILRSLSEYSAYFLLFILPILFLIIKDSKKLSRKDFRLQAILIGILCIFIGTMKFKQDLLFSFFLFIIISVPLISKKLIKPLSILLGIMTVINITYFPLSRNCTIKNHIYELSQEYCQRTYEKFDYDGFIDQVAPKLNLDNEKPYQFYISTHAYDTNYKITDKYSDHLGHSELFETFYRLKYDNTIFVHYYTPIGNLERILPGSFLILPMLGKMEDEFKLYQLALEVFNTRFKNTGFSFDMTQVKFDEELTNQFDYKVFYYFFKLKVKE